VTRPAAYALADLAAGGRQPDAPFLLQCRLRFANSPQTPAVEAELCCEEVLRYLPGRRLVVRASYQGADYAVKLFFGEHARRYYRREMRGWLALQNSRVPVPDLVAELMLPGDLPQPGFGVVTQWLSDAQPVDETDVPAVMQLVHGLGRLHAHAALRTDPHLRNYLRRADGTVYAIDGDGVRPCRRVGELRALNNLALMLAELPPAADASLSEACEVYSQARWRQPASARLVSGVRKRLARQRKLRTRRYLRKSLRECSEFHCERSGGRRVFCARDAWNHEMQTFVAEPEAQFNQGRVLKAGNSATVVRMRIDGRQVVVKRYNIKGWWHGLRRALRWTPRYRLAWLNGHRLEFLRLLTARPLALLEITKAPLNTVAYLVMEDGGEHSLEAVIGQDALSPQLVEQVVAVFRGLNQTGLVHGDTKASNFLVAADGLRLIDLDGMRPGRDLRKDVRRFLANWEQAPEVRSRFADALQAAGMPL
jgi:hypothetical protein